MIFYTLADQKPFNLSEHLALDEALLHFVDQQDNPFGLLRFWETDDYAVVLGASNKASEEMRFLETSQYNRRCSGGGTVLQGPGCLNYTLVLPFAYAPELSQIQSSNCFVMSMVSRIINKAFQVQNISLTSEVKGYTDLVIGNQKFSGNAQRRLKKTLLFHGTFLLDFDLDKISDYLKHPPKEPDYRNQRSHHEFVRNIPLVEADIKEAFNHCFSPQARIPDPFYKEIYALVEELLTEKYLTEGWREKF